MWVERPWPPLLHRSTLAIFALLTPFAVFGALWVWHLNLPFVSVTWVKAKMPFELLGFMFMLQVVVVFLLELRRIPRPRSLARVAPIALLVLVLLHVAFFLTEYPERTVDYQGSALAASAIRDGRGPYDAAFAVARGEEVNAWYAWPPLPVQVMVVAGQWLRPALPWFGLRPARRDDVIFFLYQSAQLYLVLAAYGLSVRWARHLGITEPWASGLVAALFVFNVPLVRLLEFNQINLWMLVSILLALVYFQDRPWLAGIGLALGMHVKLYPAVLLLPLLLMRRYRVVAWAAAAAFAIFLLQTRGGTRTGIWDEYMLLLTAFPREHLLRDNSTFSLVYNLFDQVGRALGRDADALAPAAAVFAKGVTAVVASWFAVRLVRREVSYRGLLRSGVPKTEAAPMRAGGHLIDGIAFMLLVSPLAWDHHYVIVVPMIIWAVAARGAVRGWPIAVAAFLMLAVPPFEIFPLSHHLLFGLLLLLYCLPPRIERLGA